MTDRPSAKDAVIHHLGTKSCDDHLCPARVPYGQDDDHSSGSLELWAATCCRAGFERERQRRAGPLQFRRVARRARRPIRPGQFGTA
jgi:hypothetical protein